MNMSEMEILKKSKSNIQNKKQVKAINNIGKVIFNEKAYILQFSE